MTGARTAEVPLGRTREPAVGRRPGLFGVVFVLDLWERFSFFGMAAILVLYLVAPPGEGGAGMSAVDATAVFGGYVSLAFLSGLPGGWLTDRLLGPRRAALVGGASIACGHLVLALSGAATLYLGLICVALGTGLVKPATAALVALTGRGRSATAAAFSIFYLSIQVSALLAPLVVGALAEGVSWHAGFAAAGAGMTAGLAWFVIGMRRAGGHAHPPTHPLPADARRRLYRAGAAAGAGLALAAVLAGATGVVTPRLVLIPLGMLTLLAGPAFVGYLLRYAGLASADRRRTAGLALLLAASSGFWLIFAQDASVLGLFARDSIDRSVGGWQVPAAWFQSLHPLFVLVLAPVSTWYWARADRSPRSLPFAAALFAGGASFVLMAGAAQVALHGPVSPLWIAGAYLLQAGGELVIGPVGLALAARLAAPGRTGQFLGLYGLFAAFGVVLGNQLYRLTAVLPLPVYFLLCGAAVVALAVALALSSPALDRLLRGRS